MLKTAGDLIKEAQQDIKCVDVAEAKKIFEESKGAVILDVREAGNAAESKLRESINVSRGLIEMKVPTHCPDPETIIFTHCAGGGRACLAAQSLQSMGYKRVYAITAPYEEILKAFG